MDFSILEYIPNLITDQENEDIVKLPDEEKVKEAIFSLNGNSAAGPNGFIGCYFQKCWGTIAQDITKVVRVFFIGQELSRYVTHTNLILLPEKEIPKSFADMRPISLSYLVNKIISRVVHGRLVSVIPRIISQNQSGFVRGKSIIENMLLAQEIIRDLNRRRKATNVVVKLDMMKVYDRVLWIFLTKVLRKFGFSEVLIDMVWRFLSNNWYSVLVNGQVHNLF